MVDLVVCWIIIHSAKGPKDYRDYKPIHGYVEREVGSDHLLVNFYDSFKASKINLTVNLPEQLVNSNECNYEK